MSKHLGKKIVSVFIALVMVLSSFPVANVFAADTEYAKVSALTDGSSIENNGSDIITVNYDESVKLDWSKAEPAIGRNADGWWVGIKIIAPENYSEEASYIAHYNGVEQSRTNKFENAKDSKPEDSEQYIQMWGFINEAVLNNAIVNGEFIENYYEFDWDGDKDYEQTIYVDVDPNAVELYNGEALVYPDTALGNVGVITESDKMSIDNNNANVVTITNKENEIINLQWSQKNAYRSADGWWAGIKMTAPEGFSSEAKYKTLYNGYDTWSPAKSFNDNKDGDSYIELWAFVNEKVKEEYASIDNYYQFDWDNDGVFEQYVVFSLDTDSIELDKTNLLAMDTAKPIISGLVDSVNYKNDDVTVEFEVIDGASESNGTEYTSGIYNVYYTDEQLDVVNVANVTALKEANKVDDSKYNFTVSNDTNKYYYIYAVDNSDNIEEGSVLVQVDKTPAQFDANPVVEPTGWTKNTVVIKGEISDNLSGINGKNNFTVTTDAENVHLSYSAIDEKTGEYTINIPAQTFSGTIVIDCVDNAGNKSTQSFSVQMDTTNCKIMSLEVSNSDWTSDDVIIEGTVIDNESGVKNVTAVLNGEHDSAKEPEVAYADGKYTITVPAQNYYGTITVNAEDNVGNNQADKDSSVSNLTVELKMDTDKPTVDEAKLSEDGWTNKDITVEGKVSDNLSEVRAVYYAKGNSIEDLDLSNIASKTFPADFDEETNTYKFKIDKQNYSGNYVIYAVDNAGNISDPKTVTVHMDTAAPVNLNIGYSDTLITKVLEFITFGFYKNDGADVIVTFTAEDAEVDSVSSGISKIAYSVNGGEYTEVDTTGTYALTLNGEFKDTFKFKAYDNAGNESAECNSIDNSYRINGIIHDVTLPVIQEGIQYSSPSNTLENGKMYFNNNVNIKFPIVEEYFYKEYEIDGETVSTLDKNVVVTVTKDGNIVNNYSLSMTSVNDGDTENAITVNIPVNQNGTTDGDYKVKLAYTDLSGNTVEIESKQFVIDTTAPIVNIEYDNNTVSDKAYDDTYFDKNRTATITVEEHNFAPEYIESAITAKDVNGNDVTAKALEDIADITDITKWHQDETDKNKYTYVIDYSDDANYAFSFTSAKDYASNEMNPENGNEVIYTEGTVSPETFTVDKVKPSDEVKYTISNDSNNLIKKVFNVLTFGIFFNSEIDIKVDTTDAISGLYRAELSIKNTDASEIENLSINGSGIFNLKEDKSKGDTTFVVDVSKLDEFRGNLYITIYDKAGNAYRNYRIVSDGSAEDSTEELIEVDGQITVNNKVIDNDVYVVDNVEQYESIDYHKEISSIDIAYTSAVNSTVNQSSPAKDSAASLVEEKVNANAVTDKNMSADNVPLFNTNVPLSINVTDNSSGISAIDIMVFDANENREIATYNTVIRNNGTIVSDTNREFSDVQNGNWSLTQNEYGLTTSASKEIIVKSDRNDIVVLVQLTDNAGNISYDYYQFGIDKTAPVLSAVFNDTTNYQNSVYYNEKRTLTLTVAERDFTNSGRTVEFTYNYQGNTQRYVIAANQFRQLDANVPVYRDNKRYSYTFDVFTNDGEYADFAFKAVDRANNETYADSSIIRSANNNMFRYDHIAPVITVVSDQHGRNENTKFYQDNRVITVTVKDRYATYNRDQSYIVSQVSNLTNFRFTDSENGQAYHTDDRTLTYVFTFQTNTSIDCRLLFNRVSDLAGNTAGNVPTIANANDFVVDGKTPNTFTATVTEDNHSPVNVLNQSDYKVFVGDNITLAITCDDENLSLANISNVRLVCAALTSGGSTEDKTFNLQKLSSSNRSRLAYSISDLDYDGFYDLSFTVTDDSGKVSSTQNVKFALCRNGALYSKTDIEKIETRVAYNAESISDIAFNQYSAQAGTSATLSISSKNGSLGFKSRILVEGTDYVITGGNTRDNELNCYKSIYQLLPNAFMMEDGRILDGVYLITITPNNTESANGQKSEQAQSTSFEVTLDATNPVISNVCTSYKTSYGSEKDYEFSQDEKKRLFTNEIELNFNISDTFSGIDPSTLVVTWGEQVIEDVLVNEDGTCTVVLNSNDPNNGNVIKLSVKDNAGNTIEYSFTLNIDNHFWIYVVVAVFVLIAVLLIIILAIKRKKEQNAE